MIKKTSFNSQAVVLWSFMLLLWLPQLLAEEFNLPEIDAYLQGPVSLNLSNGNQQSGRITSWDGETLRLAVLLGGGSAEMTFSAEEIESIRFPGDAYLDMLSEFVADPDRSEEALALFRAIYKQRGAYLQFMEADELSLFVRYARFALDQKKPLRAVAMIEVLRPHIDDQTLLKSLDDAILLGFFLGGMDEEAEAQARQWIAEADPAGGSALGWRILAEMHFRQERYEEAFWTALYPVAFANQMPMEHLDTCYAFAISAAEETRLPEVPERLFREMKVRGLSWPEDIAVLKERQPEFPEPEVAATAPAEPTSDEEKDTAIDAELVPVQTPSPVDPVESLPTRMPHISKPESTPNQATRS